MAGFSLAAFLLILALLGSQMRNSAAATIPKRPSSVIVRRIYVTTVIVRVPAGTPASAPRARSVTQTVSTPRAPAQPAPLATRTSGAKP